MDKFLVIDATALMVRSERMGRRMNLTARDGADGVNVHTAPLFLFIRSVCSYIRSSGPTHILAAWDGRHGRDWRQGRYPLYKSNRPVPPDEDSELLAQCREFLSLMGIAQAEHEFFEGDDVISWAVWKFHQLNPAAVIDIRSDDADLYQLLTTGVIQVQLASPGRVKTAGDIIAEYGITPEQLPMMKALAGDRSDNIPGITGIGPKTAARILIDAGWSLYDVDHYAFTVGPRLRQLALDFYEILNLNGAARGRIDRWATAGGREQIDLSTWAWRPELAAGRVGKMFERYEMSSLLAALEQGKLWA